jgi:MobA-like NTP transferase domain
VTVSQVVVLAGGLGTRLGALGAHGPKVLKPVAGEPFIELLFRGFARLGLTSVHLCLGHRSSDVLDHLKRSPHPELAVTHSIDTVANGGTAAALRSAGPYVSEGFLLWLGDTYVTPDFNLPDEVGALRRHRALPQGWRPGVQPGRRRHRGAGPVVPRGPAGGPPCQPGELLGGAVGPGAPSRLSHHGRGLRHWHTHVGVSRKGLSADFRAGGSGQPWRAALTRDLTVDLRRRSWRRVGGDPLDVRRSGWRITSVKLVIDL